MRVLMLAPYTLGDTIAGGAERHIKNIMDRLRSYNDLEIHVISISKEIKKDFVLKKEGVTVHQIKAIKLPMTVAGVTIYPIKMLREVKKIKPDLIHGQMIGAPYGLAAGILSKKYPTLLTVHTIIKQTSKTNRTLFGRIHDSLWRLLERWELKRIPYVIVVTPHLKEELKKDGARDISVIPNGIDASWFDIPDKSIAGRILFVGRIRAGKGIDNLIKAMKLIINEGDNAHLHVVGPTDDARYLKYLQELTKKMDVSEQVEFIGSIPDDALLNEYAECSIFVLPSSVESHPIVLLEAMASGKPVIATNVGGIPYMIEDGKDGLLVDYGDIEGLAGKILLLMNNKKLGDDIAESGKKKAMKYTWETVSERTYELYNHVYEPWKREN
jgi:glycosyltransferase involved in cell wall biosynthesis